MMGARDDGGPAFPQNDLSGYGMGPSEAGNDGMSLRDWFAGQALGPVGASIHPPPNAVLEDVCAELARVAYMVADAMLAARQKDSP